MNPNVLRELQDWYRAQCNEDWEHTFGLRIETLDNPGWMLEVDLDGTKLQDHAFDARSYGLTENGHPIKGEDWLSCRVENRKFKGAASPHKLEEMIGVFLVWARSCG